MTNRALNSKSERLSSANEMRTEDTTTQEYDNKRNPEDIQASRTSFLAIRLRCKTSSGCQKTNLTLININPELKKT